MTSGCCSQGAGKKGGGEMSHPSRLNSTYKGRIEVNPWSINELNVESGTPREGREKRRVTYKVDANLSGEKETVRRRSVVQVIITRLRIFRTTPKLTQSEYKCMTRPRGTVIRTQRQSRK